MAGITDEMEATRTSGIDPTGLVNSNTGRSLIPETSLEVTAPYGRGSEGGAFTDCRSLSV